MSSIIAQKKKVSSLDMFDIFILIAFSYNSVMVYFSAVFARLPIINIIGYYILPVFVNSFAILCFANGYFNGVKSKDFLFTLFLIFALIFSYFMHPETQQYFTQSNLRNIYVETIPFFLLGLSFRCNQQTMKNLTIISCVAIVLNAIYMLLIVGLNSKEGEYYMGQAYMILPHVMFIINSVFDSSILKRKLVSIFFMVFGLIFLIAMGTRGPLLIAIIFLAVKILFTLDRKKPWRFLGIAVFVLGMVYLISSENYVNILLWLSDKLAGFGFSTRVIDMLVENEYISHTSGRDRIFELLIQKISERPLLGYGVFGEEQFNVFAHNIALEIIMYYGVPIGVTIILAYLITALRAYFKTTNKYAKDFLLLFFIMTVVHAPFGGSHFSYYFFFLLGLSILELRNIKYKNKL